MPRVMGQEKTHICQTQANAGHLPAPLSPALTTKNAAAQSNDAVVRTHLKHGQLYADILTDWRDPQPCFIYVVQRHGSAEILAMGACNSEEEAIEYATDAMKHFRAKSAAAG